jgi:transcriptional regulator with XRE-family HTH domain
METDFPEWLETELKKRGWRPSDLAQAAGLYPATVNRVLNRERQAGPDVCNAIARALGQPPEKIFRLAGLLPPLPPAVEEEHEALGILRRLPADVRAIAMRMLRSLEPDTLPIQPAPTLAESGAPPEADDRDHPDSYVEILADLWDKVPDWKKKDIVDQINLAVEEYERERGRGKVPKKEGD